MFASYACTATTTTLKRRQSVQSLSTLERESDERPYATLNDIGSAARAVFASAQQLVSANDSRKRQLLTVSAPSGGLKQVIKAFSIPAPRAVSAGSDLCTNHYVMLEQLTRSLRFDFSTASKCCAKNRYPNVLAIEATRVKLGGDESYINANYLTLGLSRYIATQAPLPDTMCDFWQMVFEQRSPVVVCLTQFEIGRACAYFPTDVGVTQSYGDTSVQLLSATHYSDDLIVRQLCVQRTASDDAAPTSHRVWHLHYTGWPDSGVPESTLALYRLITLTQALAARTDVVVAAAAAAAGADVASDCDSMPLDRSAAPSAASERGPAVTVHCSAGIGRAGTFVAAALLCEKTHAERRASIADVDSDLDSAASAGGAGSSSVSGDDDESDDALRDAEREVLRFVATLTGDRATPPLLSRSDDTDDESLLQSAVAVLSQQTTSHNDVATSRERPALGFFAQAALARSEASAWHVDNALASNVFQAVLAMRKQRYGVVQTIQQYEFLTRFVQRLSCARLNIGAQRAPATTPSAAACMPAASPTTPPPPPTATATTTTTNTMS